MPTGRAFGAVIPSDIIDLVGNAKFDLSDPDFRKENLRFLYGSQFFVIILIKPYTSFCGTKPTFIFNSQSYEMLIFLILGENVYRPTIIQGYFFLPDQKAYWEKNVSNKLLPLL